MSPLDSHCFAVSGFCILPTLSRELRPATTLSATLELVVSHFLRWQLSEKLNNVLLITWLSLSLALPLPWLHSESPSVLTKLHPEPLRGVFITGAFAGTPYMAVQSQAVIQQSLSMLHGLMWAKSRAPRQVFLLQSMRTCVSALPGTRDISNLLRPQGYTEPSLHATHSSEVLFSTAAPIFYG